MSINFIHPKGSQILAAARESNQNFRKAVRIAETTPLRAVLKEIAQGMRPYARMLRLYTENANAAYQIAEGHFAKAVSSARTGYERQILEALADGLIGLNKAIQQDSGRQHSAAIFAQQHFSEALRLARAGRQRPVLGKFAAGLQHLTHMLLGAKAPDDVDGWLRDIANMNFARAVQLAQAERQSPTLKELALGLDHLEDATFIGMKILQ